MTEEEMITKITEASVTASQALELAKTTNALAHENARAITEVDLRVRSTEHRVNRLEGKVDTVLDKLSALGKEQKKAAEKAAEDSFFIATSNKKIKNSTLRVFITLLTAIALNVLNYFL